MNDNDWRMSHFSFGKMYQCRPLFSETNIKQHTNMQDFYPHKKELGIMPPVPVWPEGLTHITGDVLPGQAPLEKTQRVAHEALTGLTSHVTTSLLHGLEQWDPAL